MGRTILERADQMLRFFKESKPGKYHCTPEQAELIKANWQNLHAYDHKAEYTFSEDFRTLTKY